MTIRYLPAFLVGLLVALFHSCASVKAPEGGPKDSTLPKLVVATPITNSSSFAGKSIVLEFTEDVVENNPKQYFLSPITAVTVLELGRRLKITPDSGFSPNTTYLLRLSRKIKDVREGNFLRDTNIVFSTGQSIDSLTLASHVKSFANEPIRKPVSVLLSGTSAKKFFAITDSSALGLLKNIPKGRYYLESFIDGNENYTYEDEEKNLFFDSISLDSSTTANFKLLPHKSKEIKTFKQRREDTLSIECDEHIILKGALTRNLIYKNQEKTRYRFLKPKQEVLEVLDSIGNCKTDTLDLAKVDSSRSFSTLPIEKKIEVVKKGKKTEVTILYNWKLDVVPQKLEINYDSVWKSVPFRNTDFELIIELPEVKSGKLKLRVDTISFFSKSGYSLDSLTIDKTALEEKGAISGEVVSEIRQPVLVEILDASKKQIALSTGKKFMFHVKPGTYSMQVFVDWNGNGSYTGGNKKMGRKAEPLFSYPKPIELKPGWDIENLKMDPGFE